MRSLYRNKKNMLYALYGKELITYKKDSSGKVITVLIDGKEVPVKSSKKTVYDDPVKFQAAIRGKGGIAEAEAFGVDVSSYDALLYEVEGVLSFKETTVIWLDNEPKFLADGSPDPTSADYRVVRVPPSLNEKVYLLKRQVT